MANDSDFIELGTVDSSALLDEWRWLLRSGRFSVYRVTALGDMFLRDEAGTIYLLDMKSGLLEEFAGDEAEFWSKVNEWEVRQRVLGAELVQSLREQGVMLQAGECYSPDHPPVLGGELVHSNMNPCDMYVHAAIMGQIHRQVKDLPPGTRAEIEFEE